MFSASYYGRVHCTTQFGSFCCRSEASVATSPAPAPPQQQGAIDLAEMNIDGGVPSAAPSVNGTAPPSKNGSASSLCTAVGPSGSAMSMTAKARTKLLQGAVKVMRALCKLSMRTSNTPGDASVTRGRVLAMELIAIVLINHQQQFREYPQLMQVVKGDLGNCLLANCKSSSSMLQRLTCEVFVVVLLAFREEIKAKVRSITSNAPGNLKYCLLDKLLLHRY